VLRCLAARWSSSRARRRALHRIGDRWSRSTDRDHRGEGACVVVSIRFATRPPGARRCSVARWSSRRAPGTPLHRIGDRWSRSTDRDHRGEGACVVVSIRFATRPPGARRCLAARWSSSRARRRALHRKGEGWIRSTDRDHRGEGACVVVSIRFATRPPGARRCLAARWSSSRARGRALHRKGEGWIRSTDRDHRGEGACVVVSIRFATRPPGVLRCSTTGGARRCSTAGSQTAITRRVPNASCRLRRRPRESCRRS